MRLEEEFGYLMYIGFAVVILIAILAILSLHAKLKKSETMIFLSYLVCQIIEFIFLNCLIFDPGEGSDSINLGMIGILWAVGVFLIIGLFFLRNRKN